MTICYECDSRPGAFRDGLCDRCRVQQKKNGARDRQQEQLEKLQTKLQATQEKLDEQQEDVDTLQDRLDNLDALDKAKQKLDKDLEKAERKVARIQKKLDDRDEGSLPDPRKLDAKLDKAKHQAAQLQAKLKENAAERRTERSRAQLQKSLSVAKGKLDALITAIQDLERKEEACSLPYDEDEDEDSDFEEYSTDDEEKEEWGYTLSDYNARDFAHDDDEIFAF